MGMPQKSLTASQCLHQYIHFACEDQKLALEVVYGGYHFLLLLPTNLSKHGQRQNALLVDVCVWEFFGPVLETFVRRQQRQATR
jgi:hypothetical protein